MSSRSLMVMVFASTIIFGAGYSDAYRLNDRWFETATDGSSMSTQGDPSTVTYSIVADGTFLSSEGEGSDFVNMLNTAIGTEDVWLPLIQQSFDRWDELSGLTTVYEPNDDGVPVTGDNDGILGVRGDVRIGGAFIDGASSTLAYNFFPDYGDMVFDTADANFYDNTNNNFRAFRNVVMHEHGHGLGMSHIESNNSRHLMEPFIDTSFDGPRFDDLLAVQRGYGDHYEEDGGNDNFNTATSLGTVATGTTISVGTGVRNGTFFPADEIDFVSIDDNSDVDYFSFSVNGAAELDILLEPRGPTYFEGPQNGDQEAYNTKELSDLTLELYDTDGVTLISSQNAMAAGFDEMVSGFNAPGEGTYFLRISGSANDVQMYRLSVTSIGEIDGDFDDNGLYECADVDDLVAEIVAGTNEPSFDLTADGLVDAEDLTAWRAEAGGVGGLTYSGNPVQEADANLDGSQDGLDFIIWNDNKFTSTSSFCSGDFNADGVVDGLDYIVWNVAKFTSADGLNATVPEPSCFTLLVVMAFALARRHHS